MSRNAVGIILFLVVLAGQAPTGPALQIGDGQVVEGHVGTRTVDVHLTLSTPAKAPISVSYSTRDSSAVAPGDYQASKGTATFAPGQQSTVITLTVIGDTACEPHEAFEVTLTGPSGVTIADGTAQILIANDDFCNPGPPVYEVRFTFSGHTGGMAGRPDCQVRRNGRAVLTGLVTGDERSVGSSDDYEYTGDLSYSVDLDLCEVDRFPPDDDRYCAVSVSGSAVLRVDLAIYFANRGGYVKNSTRALWSKQVAGSCTPGFISGEAASFPDNSAANVFDGVELTVPSGPLRVGKYPAPGNDVHAQTFFEVLRKLR